MPQSASNGGNAETGHAAAREHAPGLTIRGKYRLERLIGEGGMGSVWRAHHLQLDLPVAIKLLRADADQESLSLRLQVEAQAAARLAHPAIVRVFDVDTTEGEEPFIVMELLEGENLSDVLDRGPLSAVRAVQTLLPIAEALELAHEKGIFHRDLKPHNIVLSPLGERIQPKLLDFGIAKLTSSPLPSGSLTDTGVAIGSPDYMSPEQARGRSDVDYRADIWQLCVVLYEAITTQTPFQGDNYNALMRSIVEDAPAPLPLEGGVDEQLAEIVHWGLTKEREQRPSSVRALGRALSRWLVARGVEEDVAGSSLASKWLNGNSPASSSRVTAAPVAMPQTLPAPRERKPAWLIGAAAAVAAAALLAWLALRGTPSQSTGSRVAATASPATEPASVVEPRAAPPIGIASTAIAPPSLSAEAARPASSQSVSTAPSGKPRDAKTDGGKRAPATQPRQVVHDETRELLQAY